MRRDLAAIGGVLVVSGAVFALPSTPAVALSAAVTPPILAALGVVVALVGAAVTADVAPTADDSAVVVDETRLGADFDATVARIERMSSLDIRRERAPTEVRTRLREAAIALVVSREGVDRETATDRVDSGEWTDDPVAAAFLSDWLRVPARIRWREWLSTTPRVLLRARRTAEILEGKL